MATSDKNSLVIGSDNQISGSVVIKNEAGVEIVTIVPNENLTVEPNTRTPQVVWQSGTATLSVTRTGAAHAETGTGTAAGTYASQSIAVSSIGIGTPRPGRRPAVLKPMPSRGKLPKKPAIKKPAKPVAKAIAKSKKKPARSRTRA